MALQRVHLPSVVSFTALDACGRMAYELAHELGNIATVVSGNAELIVRGLDAQSPIVRRSHNIAQAAGGMAEIARHLEYFLGHPSRDDRPLDLSLLQTPRCRCH